MAVTLSNLNLFLGGRLYQKLSCRRETARRLGHTLQKTDRLPRLMVVCACENKTRRIFYKTIVVVMVALWNRADHYVFAMWFLLSFYGRPMQ